jgi:hypothetical protein
MLQRIPNASAQSGPHAEPQSRADFRAVNGTQPIAIGGAITWADAGKCYQEDAVGSYVDGGLTAPLTSLLVQAPTGAPSRHPSQSPTGGPSRAPSLLP